MPEEEEERSRTSPRVLSSLGLEDDRKVCFNQRKKASVLPVSLPGALMCLPLVIPGPAGRVRACTLSSRTSGAPVNETQPFGYCCGEQTPLSAQVQCCMFSCFSLSLFKTCLTGAVGEERAGRTLYLGTVWIGVTATRTVIFFLAASAGHSGQIPVTVILE